MLDYIYQKQRIKKKYWKGNLPEQYILISEETEAVFDNSTLDRRAMNRTRKQFAEMANFRIAMFSCSQRLTEISTKYRGKIDSYLLSHCSIEDFDLKLNRMLKYSVHRKDILNLGKGEFLDTKSDLIIKFPEFKPKGQPYEYIKPKPTEQPKPQPKPKKLYQRILDWLNAKPEHTEQQPTEDSDSEKESLEELSAEDSQGDGLFIANDDSQDLFPEEF